MLFNEASVLHLAYWIIGYVVIVTEGLICLYACHQRPYGEKNRWRDLWRQLRYRPPHLPIAKALRLSRRHSGPPNADVSTKVPG
jgi:hypothetical protein